MCTICLGAKRVKENEITEIKKWDGGMCLTVKHSGNPLLWQVITKLKLKKNYGNLNI